VLTVDHSRENFIVTGAANEDVIDFIVFSVDDFVLLNLIL
jgi:hypothetical protein